MDTKEIVWKLFKETGNISYYCLYRSLGGSQDADKAHKRNRNSLD